MMVISNASPVIIFSRIKRLDILQQIFNTLYVSEEVYNEIIAPGKPGADKIKSTDWIIPKHVNTAQAIQHYYTQGLSLSIPDTTVIQLATELNADIIIIDDLMLRKKAIEKTSIAVIGSVGLLVIAKQKQIITNVKPIMDELIQNELRISPKIYKKVLQKSNEGL